MTIDFGHTAQDYAAHRAGFPKSFFSLAARWGVGLAGQRLVDLGTGTGTLARGFALRGCAVTALDTAVPMLEQARRLDALSGAQVDYWVAAAEQTGLPDAWADAVTAGQCWHWFQRPSAAAEALRILRPGGRLLIAHFDWIPLPGNLPEATERLIQRHNPAWHMAGGSGLHPQWLYDVAAAGFHGLETYSYDLMVPYTPEAWRGRIRASAGVAASLAPEQVARFDAELALLLAQRFPGHSIPVHHRVWALLAHKPA